MEFHYLSFLVFVAAVGGGRSCNLVCESGSVCFVEPDHNHCSVSELASMCTDYFCENNGTCQVVATVHPHESVIIENTCICEEGFLGEKCGAECPSCDENKECVLRNGSAVCQLVKSGKIAVVEESVEIAQNCTKSPCENDGICVNDTVCICKEGFLGANCGAECPSCEEQKECVLRNGSAVCQLVKSGKIANVDESVEIAQNCTKSPCENDGLCVNDTVCICKDGFLGANCGAECPSCEERKECVLRNGSAVCQLMKSGKIADVDESVEVARNCTKSPCKNDGLCVNDTICVCADGFEGIQCENVVCDAECDENEKCKMRNGSATCVTMGGRQAPGLIDESVCEPNPCGGDCSCEPSCKHELGYYCVSQEGYIGKNCDIAIPLVTCTESSIVVEVSDAFYNEFDKGIANSVIYVSPSPDNMGCIAYKNAFNFYRYEISLPFTDCMTSINTNNVAAGGIAFANKLWINRQTAAFFDMPVPIINFTCIYAREYTATTSLQPRIDENVVIISRSGNYAVDMSLCKQQICQTSCPSYLQVQNSAIYTIGQMIHFNVKVTTKQSLVVPQPKFVTTLEKIFLSCSPDRFDVAQILTTMAVAGCPDANQQFSFSMTSGMTSTPESVCGSIQVPRATGCNKIYIHAEVLLCLAGDLQQCLNDVGNKFCITARKRRSVEDDENMAFVVMGPITIIPGSKGRKIENLYLDGTNTGVMTFEDDVVQLPIKPAGDFPMSTQVNDVTNFSPIILIIGIISFTISCVTVVAFILSRLYRSRVEFRSAKAMELLPPTA